MWAGTVCLVVVGRGLHWVVGQHGPVAEPESEIEHEVRVWWIYPSDGAFLGGLLARVQRAQVTPHSLVQTLAGLCCCCLHTSRQASRRKPRGIWRATNARACASHKKYKSKARR